MDIYREETGESYRDNREMESGKAPDEFLEEQMEALEIRIRAFLEDQADKRIEEECRLRMEAFKSRNMPELRKETDKWVCEELEKRTAEFRKRTEEL
jgi:hypothetical protein